MQYWSSHSKPSKAPGDRSLAPISGLFSWNGTISVANIHDSHDISQLTMGGMMFHHVQSLKE